MFGHIRLFSPCAKWHSGSRPQIALAWKQSSAHGFCRMYGCTPVSEPVNATSQFGSNVHRAKLYTSRLGIVGSQKRTFHHSPVHCISRRALSVLSLLKIVIIYKRSCLKIILFKLSRGQEQPTVPSSHLASSAFWYNLLLSQDQMKR